MSIYILLHSLKHADLVVGAYTDKAVADAEAARLKSLHDQCFYVIERELQ
jgi:hypothetical protein